MSLTTLTYIAADLITLTALVGILYAPRHSRKDFMAAYIGVSVGVLAVTLLLSTASVAAGLGLRLFSVLSIIRLHSTELAQHKVTYFFATPALSLLGGIRTAPIEMVTILMGTVVAALWIGDRPALMCRDRRQVIVLDRAITSKTALIAHLERTLSGQVSSAEVQCLDLTDDTTTVDVRFRVPRHTPARLETTATFSGIAPAVQPATESTGAIARGVQTAQPWSGTHLNTTQAGSRPGSIGAQPLTMAPAAQYVTRSSSQVASSTAVVSR